MFYTENNTMGTLRTYDDFVVELKAQLQEVCGRSEVVFEETGTITSFYMGFRLSPKYNTEVEPRLELIEGVRGLELIVGGLYDKVGLCLDDNHLRLSTNRRKDIVYYYGGSLVSDILPCRSFEDSLRSIVSLVSLHYQELLF